MRVGLFATIALFKFIARVARLSGVTVHLELRIDGEDRSRGDGPLFFHAQSAIFDTLVIDPCAKSYVKGAQFLLGAATTGETRKSDLYEEDADNKITFSSQWFSKSFGGMGIRGRDLIMKSMTRAN